MRFYPRYLIGQQVVYNTPANQIKHPALGEGELVKVVSIYNGEDSAGPYEQYVVKTSNDLEFYIDHSFLTKEEN